VPVDGIAEATFARSLSGHTDLRAAARGLAGPGREAVSDPDSFADKVEQALYASKIVSYAQGWNMIAAGSDEYDWDIDLGKMAVIWRGGCIIRAAFLDRIRAAYAANPQLPTLLADPDFGKEVTEAQDGWRDVIATAVNNGIPGARVLGRPRVLRRAPRGAPARRARPGPARLLRRATRTVARTPRVVSTRCGRLAARKSAGKPAHHPGQPAEVTGGTAQSFWLMPLIIPNDCG